MDFKITLIKSLRAVGIALALGLLGGVVTTLTDASFVGILNELARLLVEKIPVVGPWAMGLVLTLLNAGVAAAVVAINNLIKHLGQ